MSYIPGILSALPGIVSLFGGGGQPSNPYLPQIQGELQSETKQAANLSGLGNQAANTYNQFNPQANQAVENYSRYLTQNPYTDAVSQALLNRATQGTTTAYQQARAQLASSLASRGMAGGGLEAGAMGGLAQGELNTLGSAAANLGLTEAEQYGQNLGTNAQMLQNAASQGFSGASSAYGGAGNLYGNAANVYANVGQDQEQDQMDQQKQQYAALENLGSGLSTAVSATMK